MKKALIALLTLSGFASADVTTLSVMPITWNPSTDFISSGSETAPEGWTQLGWGNYTNLTTLKTDFVVLPQLITEGTHGFNNKGITEAGTGQIALNNNALTLTGRSGGAQRDTLLVNVTTVSNITKQISDLEALSFTLTGTAGPDSWCWMFKMDNEGALTGLFTNRENSESDFRGKTETTLEFTPEQLASLKDTDKLVVLLREGSAGNTWTVSSMQYTATTSNVPEPTTGSLSLLALAGLCARRRKK